MVKYGQIIVVNWKNLFFRDEFSEKMVKQISSPKKHLNLPLKSTFCALIQ
jgi:hypothetical protein